MPTFANTLIRVTVSGRHFQREVEPRLLLSEVFVKRALTAAFARTAS
jgi:hypothetical protein